MLTLQMARSKATEVFQSSVLFTEYLAYGVVGGLSSLATIGGEISPFGAGWVSAVPEKYSVVAALGAAIGYVFSPKAQFNVQYIAAILLVLAFKWAINILPQKSVAPFYPLLGGGAIAVTTGMVNFSTGFTSYTAMMVLAQAILAVGSGYIFQISVTAIKRKTVAGVESIAVGTAFVVLMSGFSVVTIGKLSVGRVVLMLIVMCSSFFGGVSGGAVSGCLAALSASLLGQHYMSFGFTLGGLMSGVFRQMGRIPTAAVFSVIAVLGLEITGNSPLVVGTVIEATIASIIFICIPKDLYKKYNNAIGLSPIPTGVLGIAATKLSRTATALTEVAHLTTLVNKKIEGNRAEDVDRVYVSTADSVCRRCPNSPICWQTAFNDTMSAFNCIMSIIKVGGTPKVEDLPTDFRERCTRTDQIVDKLSTHMVSYLSKQGVKQQLSSIRTVVTDQFQGMALLLEATCAEIGDIKEQSPILTGKVAEYFSNLGAVPIWQSCYRDGSDTYTIMVKLPPHKSAKIALAKSATELGELVGESLDIPIVENNEGFTMLTYNAKPALALECVAVQSAAEGAKLCGDSYNTFSEGGVGCIILSDGMGVGGAAAVDATMTISLLSRLVTAGVSFDASLRLVNSALLVKSGEERLATVDACHIDLYSGRSTFYKAGAVPSFILRSGRVATVESSSLPAGILGGVEFAKTTLNLSHGDIIVLVSDGVVDDGYEWLPSQILSLADQPLEKLCNGLLQTAKNRRISTHEDDMTVIVAKLIDII